MHFIQSKLILSTKCLNEGGFTVLRVKPNTSNIHCNDNKKQQSYIKRQIQLCWLRGRVYNNFLTMNLIEIPMILKEIHNEYLLLDNKVQHLDDKFELIDFGLKLITQPYCIPKWGDENVVIYQSGRRYIYEQKFENDYPYHILCVDRFKNKYGVLNKLHKAISLHVFELDQIYEWKQTNTINDNDIFIELRLIINEKMPTENLKEALLRIKFLDDKQIFITSKKGEIFLISLTKQVKQLKLDANVISDKYFYKLPQEIHIKGIYLINNYQYKYYTVGLDRIIFSFCIEDSQIFDYHKFACFAGKVNKLQISKEKNLKYYHDKKLKSLQNINMIKCVLLLKIKL